MLTRRRERKFLTFRASNVFSREPALERTYSTTQNSLEQSRFFHGAKRPFIVERGRASNILFEQQQ